MNIKLSINIFLILILFFITNQLEIYVLIMVFAFIHEVTHLICGIILGFRPYNFKIMPVGFGVEFIIPIRNYNKKVFKSNILSIKKIIIAISGPLINCIIAFWGITSNINSNIIYTNLLLVLFNLLPIYPLDGGRILKNIFKIFTGNMKANYYINTISNITIIILTMTFSILILLYKNMAIFIMIIFLWVLVIKENKRYATYNKIYKIIDKNYNYL